VIIAISVVINKIIKSLNIVRMDNTSEIWEEEICPLCRRHPIFQILSEDPYTNRAYNKPRGYAGDSVMLDFIYSGTLLGDTSNRGKSLFAATTGLPTGASVRLRMHHLANMLDDLSQDKKSAIIVSLACGHFREGCFSNAVQLGKIEKIIAYDHDAESLAVAAEVSELVNPINTSILNILAGKINIESNNFIYAAGLFDYLSDRAAGRLLEKMIQSLLPGGTALVANFIPATHGRAYMESFMDWWLIYRDEQDLVNLLPSSIKLGSTASFGIKTYKDTYRNIAYLEIKKIE